MALTGFPDRIDVTLGSSWNGTGNGLDTGDPLTLQRIGATDYWSEDGTDNANPTSNRLKIRFVTFGPNANIVNKNVGIKHCKSASSAWYDGTGMYVLVNGNTLSYMDPDYNFLDIWHGRSDAGASYKNLGASYMQMYAPYTTQVGPSLSPFNVNAGGSSTTIAAALATNYIKIFSSMEDGTLVLEDKTTYEFI